MEKQLTLTEDQLIKIGFEKKIDHGAGLREDKVTFKIPTINGMFYCNRDEDYYKWYHKTEIGEAANYVHLDITQAPALFVLLQAFRVKFNLIII